MHGNQNVIKRLGISISSILNPIQPLEHTMIEVLWLPETRTRMQGISLDCCTSVPLNNHVACEPGLMQLLSHQGLLLQAFTQTYNGKAIDKSYGYLPEILWNVLLHHIEFWDLKIQAFDWGDSHAFPLYGILIWI